MKNRAKYFIFVSLLAAHSFSLADDSHLGLGESASHRPLASPAKVNLTDGLGQWMFTFNQNVKCAQKLRGFLSAAVELVREQIPELGADLRHPLYPQQFRRWMKRLAQIEDKAAKSSRTGTGNLPYFQCMETQ